VVGKKKLCFWRDANATARKRSKHLEF